MLKDFFKLDTPFKKYQDSDLINHFYTSSDLQNVLFEPDSWPKTLQGNVERSFKNVSLSKTILSEVTFRNCKFEDCLFIGTEFYDVEFHNCQFINCNFYKAKIESCYFDPKCIRFDPKYRKHYANIGATLYQTLLENSARERQPFFEIEADIRFRKWKRSQLRYDLTKKKIGTPEFVMSYGRNFLYEWICGFGYRPARFAFWTIVIFTIVATVNLWIFKDGLSSNGAAIGAPDFADSVYFTFSILTVLGFSSIVPTTSFAKIVTVFEALIGVGWMGIFTSILVKRFLK